MPSVSQLVLRMLFGFLSWLRQPLIVALLAKLLIRKEGMGGGDIKLLGMIGLFLGWKLPFDPYIIHIHRGYFSLYFYSC